MKKILSMLSLVIIAAIFVCYMTIPNIFGANNMSLKLSKNNVQLPYNGESEFIKVNKINENGEGQDVTETAEYITANENVALGDKGRILAIGPGNTIITVKKDGLEQKVNVSVTSRKDIEAEIIKNTMPLLRSGTPIVGTAASERENILNRARNMINVKWTAKKNLAGWRNRFTFKSGTTYKGIPYSQTENQASYDNFITYLGYSSFYAAYSRFNITMPKYGNDCSGFVSIAWNVARNTTSTFTTKIGNGTYPKIGSYNNVLPTAASLKSSYQNLLAGDAVVSKEKGHTFLIAANIPANGKVTAYEQTPYYCMVTYWDYSKMANDLYRPFRKN